MTDTLRKTVRTLSMLPATLLLYRPGILRGGILVVGLAVGVWLAVRLLFVTPTLPVAQESAVVLDTATIDTLKLWSESQAAKFAVPLIVADGKFLR